MGSGGWVLQHFAFDEGLVRLRKNQPSEFCQRNRITEVSAAQGELVLCSLSITAWDNLRDAIKHETKSEANLNAGLRYSKKASALIVRDTLTNEILQTTSIEGQNAQINASLGAHAITSLPSDAASQNFQSTIWEQNEKTLKNLETFTTQWNKNFFITSEGAYVFDGTDLFFFDFVSQQRNVINNPLALIPDARKTYMSYANFEIENGKKLFFFSTNLEIGSSSSTLRYYIYDLEKQTIVSTDQETFNSKKVYRPRQSAVPIENTKNESLRLSDFGIKYTKPYMKEFYQDA